ncbi:MAG: flagellar basal body P-ring formation chaperone FlgA [Rhizobiaceae bacterium]
MMRRLLRILLISASVVLVIAGSGRALEKGEKIVIVSGVIYPGQEITADMIKEVTLGRPLRTRGQVVQHLASVVGKVAQRTILPRRAIPVSAVRDAYLVEAGEPVRIVYQNGGLRIAMTGVALVSGSSGSSIRVRNPDSGRIVTGTVSQNGTVIVDPL